METATAGTNLMVSINNCDLAYDEVGTGNVPIIFLHGYPFDKSMWHGQLEFLKPYCRAIAVDLRGFGRSKDEISELSMDLFADDLIQFMDKLEIGKAIICGLSMGGYIALNAMHRYAGRFEGLILSDSQCIADSVEAKEKRYKTIEKIAAEGPVEFIEGFVKAIFHKDTFTNNKEIVYRLKHVIDSNSPKILQSGLEALASRSETCSTLGAITVPTLILCGKEDAVTPPDRSEYLHQQINGSILHIIENAGHVANLEQPEIFNKHLYEFYLQVARTKAL